MIIHNGGVLRVVIQHFAKSSPIPPRCACIYVFCVDGKEFENIWMFAQACESFHWSLLMCFSLIIHLQCLPWQLNHAQDAIESFNLHLVHHTIATLIVSTQQWEHICCAYNPLHTTTSNLGQKVLSSFFHPWCKPFLLRPILWKFGSPWNCFPQTRHLYAPMHLVLLLIKDIKPLP
jgi:hypothetical protein